MWRALVPTRRRLRRQEDAELRLLISFALLAAPSLALADDPAHHLLSGAEAFQRGDFAEALVEFRVAEQRLGPGEATWYLAASLVKLERHEEALIAFDRALQKALDLRDPVLDYYHALAERAGPARATWRG